VNLLPLRIGILDKLQTISAGEKVNRDKEMAVQRIRSYRALRN
jgi:hypothetical protein